jgi:hypothetical protein
VSFLALTVALARLSTASMFFAPSDFILPSLLNMARVVESLDVQVQTAGVVVGRHLRGDLRGGVAVDVLQALDQGVGELLHRRLVRIDPGAVRVERHRWIKSTQRRPGALLRAHVEQNFRLPRGDKLGGGRVGGHSRVDAAVGNGSDEGHIRTAATAGRWRRAISRR